MLSSTLMAVKEFGINNNKNIFYSTSGNILYGIEL